jgi:hypothetical protein
MLDLTTAWQIGRFFETRSTVSSTLLPPIPSPNELAEPIGSQVSEQRSRRGESGE